jgi:hypothetical protein
VEDPATGLHRPRNYMQSLESRVVYLEALLREVHPDIALGQNDQNGPSNMDTGASFLLSTSPQTTDASSFNQLVGDSFGGIYTSPPPKSRQPSSFEKADDGDDGQVGQVDHLSSEVALLCLNAAGGEPHYFGPSSAVSFSRIVSATMGLKGEGSSCSPRDFEENEEIPPIIRPTRVPRLPSPSVSANLSRAYFNNIHPQYPFLHRPTFLKWEQDICDVNQSGDNSAAGDIPLFFVLMVCIA